MKFSNAYYRLRETVKSFYVYVSNMNLFDRIQLFKRFVQAYIQQQQAGILQDNGGGGHPGGLGGVGTGVAGGQPQKLTSALKKPGEEIKNLKRDL